MSPQRRIIITLLLMLVPVSVYAESPTITKKSLLDLSEALAYDLGKTYQMGQNCKRELDNFSPPKTAGFFINYFNEQEVQTIMDNYGKAMGNEKSKGCDMKELKVFMPIIIEKLANYIKLATPFTRPYSQK